MNTHLTSFYKDPNDTRHTSYRFDKDVIIPAVKAPTNINCVCPKQSWSLHPPNATKF